MNSVSAYLPRWTKRVSIEEGGRDPLGLSRVSGMITDFLLQGIITQTYRARYYSFYCWAIWHIEQTEPCAEYNEFAAAFQRRDSLFTLASLQFNPNSSPVGVRVAASRLADAKKNQEVSCSFQVLPSNQLGAFGQYYTGSIHELGLTSRDEKGIYHVSPSGETVARSFHETLLETPYLKKKLFLDNALHWKDFAKTADAFNLDGLARSPKERDLLTKLFFSAELKSDRALMRKSSLSMLLYILNAYEAADVSVKYGDVWKLVYAPFYYGQLEVSEKKALNIEFPNAEKTCAQFWALFCIHQLLTQALENLLSGVLELTSTEVSGLPIDEICSRLTAEDFLTELQEIHGLKVERPVDLLASLGLTSPRLEPAQRLKTQSTFKLKHPRSESKVLDRESASATGRTAKAVSLLVMLYAKWHGLNSEVARAVSAQTGNELHAETVLPFLSQWFDQGVSWARGIEPILSKLILDQHDRIMYEKGKLESCWLHRTDGRVIKDQDYFPSFRSPRSDNSVSILTDLGLISRNSGNQLKLTARGKALLKKVTQ